MKLKGFSNVYDEIWSGNWSYCIGMLLGIQSQAEGNFVRNGQTSMLRIAGTQGRVLGFQSDSHEKTLNKGGNSTLI